MASLSLQRQGLNHEQQATLEQMIKKAESQITDEVIQKAREVASQDAQTHQLSQVCQAGGDQNFGRHDNDSMIMMGQFHGGDQNMGRSHGAGLKMGSFHCAGSNMGGGAKQQGRLGAGMNAGAAAGFSSPGFFDREGMQEALKQVTVLGGTLYNKSKGGKSVMKEKKWEGYFLRKYPTQFDGLSGFLQSGLSASGVKAGVVYSGKNNKGVECGWLVAWTDSTAGTKIYAECGPRNNYSYVDWYTIKEKMEQGGAIAKYSDDQLGISVYATIVGGWGKHALAIVFSG